MVRLGVHPRFAHMALRSAALGAPELGCLLASLLSERDVLRSGSAVQSADIALRLDALAGEGGWAQGARASHCTCTCTAMRKVQCIVLCVQARLHYDSVL